MTHDKEFTYLVACRPIENNYKFYQAVKLNEDSFDCKSGRIGGKGTAWSKSLSQWRKKYNTNTSTKKGYIDRSEYFELVGLKENIDGKLEYDIEDKEIHDLMVYFMTASNTAIKNNYVLSNVLPTDKLFARVQGLINMIKNDLSINCNIDDINENYLELISLSQRKISDVKTALYTQITNDNDLQLAIEHIENEQELLDTLQSTVKLTKDKLQEDIDKKKTELRSDSKFDILKSLGLIIEPVTIAEEQTIKDVISEDTEGGKYYKNAWKVTNVKQQEVFDEYVSGANNTKTRLLWHGSQTRNYLGIIENSLPIRPSVSSDCYSGSMWDDGIYGACDYNKSFLYTSGGYYNNSSSDGKNILLLFEFHVGNQLIKTKHDNSSYTISKQINGSEYNSVWAKAGDSLFRDEFIVYNSAQTTPKYIVEFE